MKILDEKNTLSLSKNLRKNILDMSLSAGAASSHFGGALSCVDIISVLFQNIINYDKQNYKKICRDRFVLSKGHACMALYSILYELGILSSSELNSFEKSQSILLGHPVQNLDKGIELSTGSLGMGISISMGFAIAAKRKKLDSKIYTIIGDGECNEGSVWEVALSAPKFNLDNFVVIVDRNKYQQTGSSDDILNLNSLTSKWKSFNWDVFEINGHDIKEIYNALVKKTNLPKVIIANTVKGKGFTFSEDNNDWHHKILTKSQYEEALKELEK
jgi:transketolase